MVELYKEAEAQKAARRAFAAFWSACGIFAAGTVACIVLAFLVNTKNAEMLLAWVIAIFTLSGWAFLLMYNLLYRSLRAKSRHMALILEDEGEVLSGILKLSDYKVQIPKSVLIRRAKLCTEDEEIALSVFDGFADMLPESGALVRIVTVRGYIKAYEVLHEND